MAIACEKLLNRDFGTLEHTYTERDTILYALGVGLGLDPLDDVCLQFVYEDILNNQSLEYNGCQIIQPGKLCPGCWNQDHDRGRSDWWGDKKYTTADAYGKDAMEAVKLAKEWIEG